MKYTIVINQLALQEIAPELDVIDATLLDYLIHFCSAEDARVARITFTEGGTTRKYVWINYKHLINELPIIKIKSKSAISSRVAKIEKAGFIKTKQEFGTKGRLYVLLTENIKALYFNNKGSSKRTLLDQKDTGVFVQTNIQHSNKKVESKDSTGESTLPVSGVPGKKGKGDPRIREVIGFFMEACQNIKGFKPRVTPGVAGTMVQKFLLEYSVDEITDELSWFLNAEESKKLSCTIRVALSAHVFNKWLAQRETY